MNWLKIFFYISVKKDSCAIKILYKTVFLYKSSWKVESAQLENFYFPVSYYVCTTLA